MSNRVEPKLNTQLDILPKENIILPLNLRSVQSDSFPNMKTPKLQPLNVEIVTFPGLRGAKSNNIVKYKKEIKPVVKKSKKIISFGIIFLIAFMAITLLYTVLLYIKNLLI